MAGAQSLATYHALPDILQHVATALNGVQVRSRRYGRAFAATRRALRESEREPASEVAARQAAELARLVRRAAAASVYYRELFARNRVDPERVRSLDELRRIPPLERSTLLERISDVQAPVASRVRRYFTSGTTGTTLVIPIDDDSRQRNYAFFARALSWAGVEGGRSATFAGRPVVPPSPAATRSIWRWNPAMRNRLFSSYHLSPANAAGYSRALCAFRPDYIDSYPSAAATLASLLKDAGLPAPRPRAVITSSETLGVAQRELIEEVFGARCFDQYGSTEQAAFVSQCEHGSYHVHPEYGIVEVVDSAGEPVKVGEQGEMVCTSFTNDALPLIRYRTGDVAVRGEAGCRCGRAFPTIAGIVGRTDDLLVTPDGRRIGRLDPVFKGRLTIREAQIVQETASRVCVRIVGAEGYTDEDGASVRKELAIRLGAEMEIQIVRVDSIERTASGKFRAVVNRVQGAGAPCR